VVARDNALATTSLSTLSEFCWLEEQTSEDQIEYLDGFVVYWAVDGAGKGDYTWPICLCPEVTKFSHSGSKTEAKNYTFV
jgi:hypothetical protein